MSCLVSSSFFISSSFLLSARKHVKFHKADLYFSLESVQSTDERVHSGICDTGFTAKRAQIIIFRFKFATPKDSMFQELVATDIQLPVPQRYVFSRS